jgi:hypothetical protein
MRQPVPQPASMTRDSGPRPGTAFTIAARRCGWGTKAGRARVAGRRTVILGWLQGQDLNHTCMSNAIRQRGCLWTSVIPTVLPLAPRGAIIPAASHVAAQHSALPPHPALLSQPDLLDLRRQGLRELFNYLWPVKHCSLSLVVLRARQGLEGRGVMWRERAMLLIARRRAAHAEGAKLSHRSSLSGPQRFRLRYGPGFCHPISRLHPNVPCWLQA